MSHTLKDQRRRDRLREYEAALTAARSALAVLALLVQGRESRACGESLEEAFAATPPAADDGVQPFPAAVWVVLRQGDIDATLDLLITLSGNDFVIASHEQLDEGYRLTTVDETRGLPDIERLQSQLAAFLHVPADVVAVIAGWGPDDPRTVAEIDALLEQRFGATAGTAPAPVPRPAAAPPQAPSTEHPPPSPQVARGPGAVPREGGLTMSAQEFGALLNLSPEQRGVLATLVRQTTIIVDAHD